MSENGCDSGGREVRKAHEDQLEELKEGVRDLWQAAATAAAFRSNVKLAGVILGMVWSAIWVGSFLYTGNHIADSDKEHDQLHRVININSRDIGDLKGSVLVTQDRYSRLLLDIEKLNNNMTKVLDALVPAHATDDH